MMRLLWQIQRSLLGLALLFYGAEEGAAQSPVTVTLLPTTSPAAGEPGVTNISVIGSNFPAGTIPAANVTVRLTPKSGGPAVNTQATLVTTVVSTTRRISFTIPATVSVLLPTPYQVAISGTTSGDVAFQSSNASLLTVNPAASISTIMPSTGQPGQTLPIAITGSFSNFLQGATVANFGTGITINSTQITDATHATVNITISANAEVGPRTVTMTTGTEVATLTNGFGVSAAGAAPTITNFNPTTASFGTLITITGTGLLPKSGTAAQVALAKQGGGALAVLAASTAPTTLTFVVPTGAATGVLGITVNGGNASTATPLTIVPSSGFTITAAPSAASLIQGQSVAYSVQLSSANGFNDLAQLSVAGVPSGVTASFSPAGITAGQTSILTLNAPSGQSPGTTTLSISASATVGGLPVTQNASASLSVVAPTTTLLGRTVVSNDSQTPLAGVTIKTLGLDGNGNTTGCTGNSTTSDAAGNFALSSLPMQCTGPQLISFDGTTATAPPGRYAGVNLVFTLNQGQVTASPVLVHLPRIDNVETFLVTQNASTNQTYAFTSIPGLSVTVYAGTTFTLADGTQPNPFPLAAVQVPVDRLPDAKPNVPTMIRSFIVAFQPANTTANEPVAVFFPNTLNTPPSTDMALMTLDPTHGQMVPYGTGAVSADGTEIVPDADPAHPGHLFGLVHFDWHGPMPPPPPQPNPAPPGSGYGSGSGPGAGPGSGPGGSSGPGAGDGGDNGGDDDGSGNGGNTGDGGVDNNPPDSGCNTCPCTQTAATQTSAALYRSVDGPANKPYEDSHGAEAGDPVDLSSGVQTISHRDIAVQGSRGTIALVRTYRSMTTQSGPFGIGTSHNFNYGLDTAFPTLTPNINLILPDGNRFLFATRACPLIVGPGIPPCTPGKTNGTIPALAGAVMTVNGDNTTDLRWKNGTIYHFVPIGFQQGSMLGLITDRNGNQITIARDASGNVTSVTDPVGRSLVFTFDSSNRVTSITDPIGRIVTYTYNTQGSLATFTNPAGGVTQYNYDSNNNLLKMTDARNIVRIQNTLDTSGRVIQQARADGGTLTFSYTPANPTATVSPIVLAQVTDSTGVQSTYRFNLNGYLTDVTNTQGQTRSFTFLSGTNFHSGAIEATATTTYTSDATGNVLTSTDPTGLTTTFTYEPIFNKVTSITDPLGHVSRFAYDGNGNLLKSTDANGNVTFYQYDSTGLVTQITDAVGQRTGFTYDGLGNLAFVTDPLGNTTSSAYDGISRLTQVVDALGRRTSFTYDALGRRLSSTDAKGGVTSWTYDADGNVVSIKDARGNTNSFSYDPMNRLVGRTDALGDSDSRTYDTNGNLLKYVDRRHQTSTFVYDNLNRLTTETYDDATVARTYDFLGRLQQVNDSASGVFTFNHDLAGRLLTSTTPFGSMNYTYDGGGFMSSRQVVGQPTLSYSYDSAGNLTAAAMPNAAANFTYTPRNQLATINRMNGVSSTLAYDPDARLLTLTHAGGTGPIDAESYTYDAVGNRMGHSTSIGQSLITQPTSNQYNFANQLTLFGSVPDSYDGNGNLVHQSTTTAYTWDARNRLKSIVTTTGQTTNFTYDFAGNLIQQSDSGPTLNLTKSFVLDDLTNEAYEAASDGTSYSALSGRSIDSDLAIAQSTGPVQYGLTDAINSTIATVDHTGAVNSQFFYDAFGQTTMAGTYPFQFTGRVPVTVGLYYNRARFYNSQTGRFISEDPIGFGGGTNLYRYVSNAPTLLTDPLGLQGTVVTSTGTVSGLGPPEACGVAATFGCTYLVPPPYDVVCGILSIPACQVATGQPVKFGCEEMCGVTTTILTAGCGKVAGTLTGIGSTPGCPAFCQSLFPPTTTQMEVNMTCTTNGKTQSCQ